MGLGPQPGEPPQKRRRRGPLFWLGRFALGLVLLIAGLAVAGLAYQAVATARDQRDFPPPGQMVDVGGYRLHILCTGTAQPNAATVILEAGTGLASPAWALVQASVSPLTRVCAYDRAGNGWSDSGPLPRDARQIATELHKLLEGAAIPGPYVLVGHSFGGMYVRAYRDAFPADVAGLVLVDSSHPDQLTSSPARSAQVATFENILRIAPLLARLGIVRLMSAGDSDTFDLPPQERAAMTAFGAKPEQSTAVLAELLSFPEVTDLLHKAASLSSLPVFVLTAGKGADPDWPALQAELGGLSSNSISRTVDADHVSLLFSNAGAKVVSDAIAAVLEAARTGKPLS